MSGAFESIFYDFIENIKALTFDTEFLSEELSL